MKGAGAGSLDGMGVLVTRPEAQAGGLCRSIEQADGRPIRFPAARILPPEAPAMAKTLLMQDWDMALYVSANAVEFAARLVPGLPNATMNGAVGRASADALASHGRKADLLPTKPDSEGLLALPQLQAVHGRRILIVRGQGGRALLGDTLAQRGARVSHAEVYRRTLPDADPAPLLAAWRQDVQAVVSTSVELLHNLCRLLGAKGLPLLAETPLVVISERMRQAAAQLGLRRIHQARAADDASLLAVLLDLAKESGDER